MVVGVKGVPGVQRIATSDVDMVVVMHPVNITNTPQQQLVVRSKLFVYFCVVRFGVDHIPGFEVGEGILFDQNDGGARMLIKYLPDQTFK